VIRKAAEANREKQGYEMRTIPWIGIRQDTFQSAFVEDGVLTRSFSPPDELDPGLADGDGSVPRVSAIPSDWSEQESRQLPRFAAEQHGWLTNNDMTLSPLLATITQLMSASAQNLYGKPGGARPSINLRAESIVALGEAVIVRVALTDYGGAAANLEVLLKPVDRPQQQVSR
jgi:hypothetical protein